MHIYIYICILSDPLMLLISKFFLCIMKLIFRSKRDRQTDRQTDRESQRQREGGRERNKMDKTIWGEVFDISVKQSINKTRQTSVTLVLLQFCFVVHFSGK